MKRNRLITLLFLLFIFLFIGIIQVNAANTNTLQSDTGGSGNGSNVSSVFDAGECINNFGSITLKKTGSNNDVGGKVVFHNKKNTSSWNTDPVTFDAKVESTTGHKVTKVYYSITSKYGYSCSGTVTGTSIEDNTGSVTLSVTIDKGYVSEMSFYGRSVNRNDSSRGDMTKSNIIKIRKEMTDAEIEGLDEELYITTGETLQCDTLDDLLSEYWVWVMVLMPVITIILMTIDFVSALLSNDSDSLKKASNKALKRVLALVILLLLPIIINILFGLFSIETCF